MARNLLAAGLIGGALIVAAPAAAQLGSGSLGGLAGLGGGGSGGLLGGALSGVGGASVGNAAGVLSYCVKNKLVGGTGAKSALSGLLGRQDVAGSEGFAAGQSGTIVTGQGQALPLDGLKGKLKTRICDMVLSRAQSFLPTGGVAR